MPPLTSTNSERISHVGSMKWLRKGRFHGKIMTNEENGGLIPMTEMMKKLKKIGIIPVVVLNDVKDALPLGECLMKGGLPCAEVTFRTAAAEESIRQMAKAYPDMIIGAGTVLTTEQADRAIDAGAKFVAPTFLYPLLACHV